MHTTAIYEYIFVFQKIIAGLDSQIYIFVYEMFPRTASGDLKSMEVNVFFEKCAAGAKILDSSMGFLEFSFENRTENVEIS